ncbi:CYTH domain protein [compost metagenome]
MNTEIEAKFVNVDHEVIRQLLNEIGAKLEQPMRLMKRVTIDSSEMKAKNAFVRVRDQGDKVTLTYKQFDELSVNGAKEIEVTVNNFDETIGLFAAAGLPYGSFQESKRETWRLGSTEIVLDVWPWLDPYIEIEGESEDDVITTATQLGLKWPDAIFGDVMAAYRVQYPHLGLKDTIGNISEVRFSDPLPELLKN